MSAAEQAWIGGWQCVLKLMLPRILVVLNR